MECLFKEHVLELLALPQAIDDVTYNVVVLLASRHA